MCIYRLDLEPHQLLDLVWFLVLLSKFNWRHRYFAKDYILSIEELGNHGKLQMAYKHISIDDLFYQDLLCYKDGATNIFTLQYALQFFLNRDFCLLWSMNSSSREYLRLYLVR